MGGDVSVNRFGLHQPRYMHQTASRDDTVVSIKLNTIKENARCERPLQLHQKGVIYDFRTEIVVIFRELIYF